MDATPAVPAAPAPAVTLGDVRAALAAMGVRATDASAGRVRAHIGRGSQTTIQRHLEVLRAEERQQAEPPEIGEAVPPVPTDISAGVSHLWATAYRSAHASLMARILRERERAGAADADLRCLRADLEAAQQIADDAESRAAEAEARATAATQQMAAMRAALEQQQAELARAQQEAAHTVEVLRAEHAREIELLAARHDAAIAALRGEIDRQAAVLATLAAALQQKAP